ncbi:hypothetical protein GE061_009451 [Apolygus lucorum]|uniref:MAGUK p55 subfamily member 6 n=1 Tax=Apolygus lucorum TaxID=248454 RepID=A0A8S9Y2A4_APOLU|nr:hypothetical protein GE061_009451 [Apolygus lucorum]
MVLFGKKRVQERRALLSSTDSICKTKPEAMDHIKENIYDLEKRTGAKDTDILFLKSLIEDPLVRSIVNAQDSLEKRISSGPDDVKPVATGTAKIAKDLTTSCRLSSNLHARELSAILSKPHVKALLETHDTVAVSSRNGGSVWESTGSQLPLVEEEHTDAMATQAIRVVGLRKMPSEPLGLTVEVDEDGNLIVARILSGGAIERQGLLKPGDVIIEVNDTVTFRVAPSMENIKTNKPQQTFMKALFEYDPLEDTLLPCKEIGLAFKPGDILQILDTKDPNWWQAKKVGQDSTTGLIPSQEMEERRKAFVAPEADYVHKISISKKKRKFIYKSKIHHEFDKAELLLYEEVALMPPFNRRTLAIVGSLGVGRRTLKNRLINSDPNRYGSVIPMTSRPIRELEENGKSYWFVTREQFENEIADHQLLEYGEHNGHLYGTNLESIRDVIRQGKMCILDCSPSVSTILEESSFKQVSKALCDH